MPSNVDASDSSVAIGVFFPLLGRMRAMNGSRGLIYFGTFIGGAAALLFQVVWQRYLALLFGSEARSICLVVAVFLLGLASGYRFWGGVTGRAISRRNLLRTLGCIEFGIAGYALAFPWLFPIVRTMAYAASNVLALDFLWASILLMPPTFLMGASIPMLTAAVPEQAEEVNHCHARIYGINTLGAFLGALSAGLLLVPWYGLLITQVIGAIMGLGASLIFLTNRLQGGSQKATDIPHAPNRYGRAGVYALVCVTGGVSIGLEVLFARVLALSMGPSQTVFPIVVSVVILGLAIGSLTLRRDRISAATVPADLVRLSVMLALIYLSTPYWPYWLSCLRVSMSTIPSNYPAFLGLVVVFVMLFLLPVYVTLGRLLPMGYALLDKTRDDYGAVCGRVYFANTIGTVLGSVGLGYAIFWIVDLPWAIKLCIALLLLLACGLCVMSRWTPAALACGIAMICALLLPSWNRDSHVAGLYRFDELLSFHFSGLFVIPEQSNIKVHSLEDDPGMTVASFTLDVPAPGADASTHTAASVTVNGKSDGNTIGDYSNMVLTALLPYVHAPDAKDIDVAVVGLGTGLTTGASAGCDDVRSVTTLEISPAMINTETTTEPYNFGAMTNPKSHVVRSDAFRFFARTDARFDIIISEPSNVWVAGVENLFTPEFYQLVDQRLADDGVFFQWFQIYEMDSAILREIAANVLDRFPYASMFEVGLTDVGILASRSPISRARLIGRLEQEHVRKALEPIGIDDARLISLIEVYPHEHLVAMAYGESRRRHSIETPWIGAAAGRARFLKLEARLGGPVMDEIGRHLPVASSRREDFASIMRDTQADAQSWCQPAAGRFAAGMICGRMTQLGSLYRSAFAPMSINNLEVMLDAYGSLREQGYLAADGTMLHQAAELVRQTAKSDLDEASALRRVAALVVMEFANEWLWTDANQTAVTFNEIGVLTRRELESLQGEISDCALRGRERAQRLDAALKERAENMNTQAE